MPNFMFLSRCEHLWPFLTLRALTTAPFLERVTRTLSESVTTIGIIVVTLSSFSLGREGVLSRADPRPSRWQCARTGSNRRC